MILAGGGNKCDEDASGGGNVDHSHDNDKKMFSHLIVALSSILVKHGGTIHCALSSV